MTQLDAPERSPLASLLRGLPLRLWRSPGATTAASVSARALAFFAPIPLVTARFSDEVVALWFLIMTFQALATSIVGTLPTILMHMVAHANAGATAFDRQTTARSANDNASPNVMLLQLVSRAQQRIFGGTAIIWMVLAASVGTLILNRPISLSGMVPSAISIWVTFILGAACRLYLQGYATFLLGRGQVARVRRLEAITWTAAGISSTLALTLVPNLVLAMSLLQAPFLINLLLLRRLALQYGWEGVSLGATGDAPAPVGILRQVLPRAWRGWVGVVAATATTYGSGLLYAQVGDSASVAAYAMALNVFGLISQLSNSQIVGALPALSHAYAQGNASRHRLIARRALVRSLAVYGLLVPTTFAALTAANRLFAANLPVVSVPLWSYLALAYFLQRYASFHLHYFTITNDIRWHIFQGTGAFTYFLVLAAAGTNDILIFPLAQIAAFVVFPLPFARFLTWRHMGFRLRDDLRAVVASLFILAIGLVVLTYLID